MERERPQDRRGPRPAQRQRRFALEQQTGGHDRQPPHPQSNGPGVEGRHEHPTRGAGTLDDRRDAVDQRREDHGAAARHLQLHVHQQLGPTRLEHLLQRRDLRARHQGNPAQDRERRVGDALGTPSEPRQVVIVENDHLPRPADHHVQLDTVGAVGAGPRERSDAVRSRLRSRPVADDQGNVETVATVDESGSGSSPPLRRRHTAKSVPSRPPRLKLWSDARPPARDLDGGLCPGAAGSRVVRLRAPQRAPSRGADARGRLGGRPYRAHRLRGRLHGSSARLSGVARERPRTRRPPLEAAALPPGPGAGPESRPR